MRKYGLLVLLMLLYVGGRAQQTTKPSTPSQKKSAPSKKVAETTPKKEKNIILVIDPGHGGSDPGKLKSSPKYKDEKELTLAIALKFGKLIEKNLKNVKVIYTRQQDKRVSLDAIVDTANLNKADFFISLHCNANPVKKIYGAQFHIQNHRFLTSRALAESLEKEFLKINRKSWGVIDRHDRGYNYQILQYTEMPGVLVEMGFMSNPLEEKYLNSAQGQDSIAHALFRGFKNLLSRKKAPLPDIRTPFYKVQIACSKNPENLATFKHIGMRVDEIIDEKGKFRYRYMVGREYERLHAQELAEKLRKMGYKDAFVVKMPLD